MKIDFEMTRDGLTFRDAIHLPDNHPFTNDQIEAMKQVRFDRWWAAIHPDPQDQIAAQDEVQE